MTHTPTSVLVRAVVALLLGLAAGALLAPTGAWAAAARGGGQSGYPESGDWLVEQGDTLCSIAREALDDCGRYTEIFALNQGQPQAVGGTLTDPSILRVGWVLQLPPLSPPAAGAGTTPPADGSPDDGPGPQGDSPGSGAGYTVVAGDTLFGIAQRELGDGSRYDEIFAINRGRPQTVGGTLADPSVLRVGWVLELPGEAPAPAPGGETYRVQAGDTLYGIARDTLGDGNRYPEILALNQGQPQAVGGTLADPSVLRVGWVLQLPAA